MKFTIPFSYKTKNSEQKLKYLKNKKSFQDEKKAFFIFFKGLLVGRNYLRRESAPLIRGLEMLHKKEEFDQKEIE